MGAIDRPTPPPEAPPLPLPPSPLADHSPTLGPRPAGRQRKPSARKGGENPVVDCAVYVDGHRQAPVTAEDALGLAIESGGFVWLGLYEPTQAEFDAISGRYGLHPLAVEDAVYAHQRPKLERYDDALFMVLKTATYVAHEELTATSEVVDTGEVMVFLGANYVITVRHGGHSGLADLRSRLEEQRDVLCLGPAAVLYAVADLVVDTFVEVASAVEEDVDELEASVFSPDRTDDIGRLYHLKRELMQLRRAVSPLEVPLSKLADRPIDVVPEAIRSYFRDVLDHAIRVRDQVASLDELLSSIMQASLARTSLADNEDVRKISAYAGIIAVPTAIAGIYGMNFDYMPELEWRYGYPMVWLIILFACFLLHRAFKRNGWL
ncbi:MAG: corA [Blastococcus sp.]|jgi:magnesium transporter|nr:corA [Blastococcus sp.]